MELHNLHRQSNTFQHASGAQDPFTSDPARHPATRSPVTPEEWAKLMKENDTLHKMVHKLAYQVEELKESHKAVKAKADKYKQQLQLHVEAQEGFAAKHDKLKAQFKTVTAERDRLQTRADEHKGKLAATTTELKELKAQIPEVQKLLAKGGEAHRKVQTLEEKEGRRVQDLQKQLAECKAKLRGTENPAQAAKVQQLQSELTATRERLKAAAGQASTSISQVQSCKDMLAKADEVLRTCSELHASKGDALASALQHTTNNLEAFLKTL